MKTLTCNTCGATIPESDFRFRAEHKGKKYFDRRCKRCNALRARAHRRSGRGRYVIAYHIAKRRNIPWNLTKEEYLALIANPCYYCGWPLPTEGMGLDRLDFDGDYSPSNVKPCCTECNLARGVWFTPDEMRLIGEVIGRIKAARVATGQPPTIHKGWGRPRIHQD